MDFLGIGKAHILHLCMGGTIAQEESHEADTGQYLRRPG